MEVNYLTIIAAFGGFAVGILTTIIAITLHDKYLAKEVEKHPKDGFEDWIGQLRVSKK